MSVILPATIKIGVSVTILVVLYSKFKSQLPAITSIDVIALIVAASFLLLQPVLIGVRWRYVLVAYGMRRRTAGLIRITWVSVFANQFLPAGVGGDAIRIFYAQRTGVPLKVSIASVVVDRIVALIALTLLLFGFIVGLDGLVDRFVMISVGVILFLGIVFAHLIADRRELPGMLSRYHALAKVFAAAQFLLVLLKDRRNSMFVLSNAMGVHFLSAAAFLVVARAIGIEQSSFVIVTVALVLAFVQMIPVSIGGWGLREMASVGIFSAYGVDGGRAALASVLLGVAYLIASLPGAVLWFSAFKDEILAKSSSD